MHRSFIIAGIVIAFMPGVVASGDDSAETARQARKLAGTKVITNDLLERLYGPSAPGVPPVEAVPESALMDPMVELEYQLDSRRTTRLILFRARARVAEAEKHVEMLEARKLAVVNPYLPRPVLTETEASAWEGLDNVERARLTDQAIADARTELDAARQALERIRRGG